MDMSQAAIAPRQPRINEADRAHPLFGKYMAYRSGMSCQLVEADSFENWLAAHKRDLNDQELMKHPLYNDFQKWMRDTKGGAPGKCKLSWPANFHAWIGGARW